ncbi:MAG: hypothetical protein ACRDMZ_15235, partial [Solirubrobacteraceae bacterium]
PAVNRNDGRRIVGPLDPRALGRAAHEVIQDALADGVRCTDYRTLSIFVGRHEFVQLAPTYRQSSRARLTHALSVYMNFFVPPDTWELIGCEVSLGDPLADIVWRDAEGRIVLDELKAHRCRGVHPHSAQRQVEALLQGARDRYGKDLAGVRYVLLGAPGTSRWVGADGENRLLLVP